MPGTGLDSSAIQDFSRRVIFQHSSLPGRSWRVIQQDFKVPLRGVLVPSMSAAGMQQDLSLACAEHAAIRAALSFTLAPREYPSKLHP